MSKYKKGDKFLIEIAERHSHYTDDGKEYNLYRIKGFNSLVFDDYGLDRLSVFKNYEDRGKTLHILIDNYLKYEKALDKACEWITDNDGWVNIFGDEDWRSRFPNGVKTKEEWKEWLLKDE